MSLPIQPVTSPALASVERLAASVTPSAASGEGSFQRVLQGAIGNVEQGRQNAAQTVERFLSGEGEEVHNVVLATQKAELNFELFLQVRNKVVAAYQEVMRMQL